MESLTQDQLAYLRRYGATKNPKTIARDLSLDLSHVQEALRSLRGKPKEPWTRSVPVVLAFALAIVLTGLVAYSNNLRDGWHFDDNPTIVANDVIHNPSFRKIYEYNIYRQFLYWTFAASWKLHKDTPWGWHVENNAIHVLNGLLVFGFTLVTLSTPRGKKAAKWPVLVAGLAGLIFVAHPLETQAVTYVTQRTESLCATFYLLALGLYGLARIRRAEGRASGEALASALPLASAIGGVILSAIVFGKPEGGLLKPFLAFSALAVVGGAGLLVHLVRSKRADGKEAALLAGSLATALVCMETKEIGGTLPVVALLWEALFMGGERAAGTTLPVSFPERLKPRASALPFAVMAVLLPMLAVRVNLDARFLLREDLDSGSHFQPITGPEYFLTEFNVLATYLRLFVLPYAQSLDYDYPKATDPGEAFVTLLSIVAVTAAVVAALRGFRRAPVLSWGVLAALLVLAPTSSVFVLPDLIYEHRCYLPVAGAAFVTASVLERIVRRLVADEKTGKLVLVGACAPLLVVLVLLTRARNEVWFDDATLWNDARKTAPRKPRPWTNLGLYYQNVEPFRLTLQDGRTFAGDIVDGANIGAPGVYIVIPTLHLGNAGRGRVAVKKTEIASGPSEWGGLEKAIVCYDTALALDPGYYKARNNKAVSEIQQGTILVERIYEMNDALEQEKQRNPAALTEAYLKSVHEEQAQLEAAALSHFHAAKADLFKILEDRPKDVGALANISSLDLGYLNDLDEAIDFMQRSIIEGRNQGDEKPIAYVTLGDEYWHRARERSKEKRYNDSLYDLVQAMGNYQTFLAKAPRDEHAAHARARLALSERYYRTGGKFEEDEEEAPTKHDPFSSGIGADPISLDRFKPSPAGSAARERLAKKALDALHSDRKVPDYKNRLFQVAAKYGGTKAGAEALAELNALAKQGAVK